jgi:hypothetical protein
MNGSKQLMQVGVSVGRVTACCRQKPASVVGLGNWCSHRSLDLMLYTRTVDQKPLKAVMLSDRRAGDLGSCLSRSSMYGRGLPLITLQGQGAEASTEGPSLPYYGITTLSHLLLAACPRQVIFTEALTHGTLPWRGKHQRRTLFYKYHQPMMAWADYASTP